MNSAKPLFGGINQRPNTPEFRMSVIRDVYEAFSTLTDLREVATDPGMVRGLVNHAQAHLRRVLDEARATDREVYLDAIDLGFGDCSLED